MTKSAHKLKTLRVEFELSNKNKAHEMQNKMSQLCRQHFIPVIDKLCSEFSPGDQIHKIDRLEIDLGEFNLSTSEYSLKELFTRKLEENLQRHFIEVREADLQKLVDHQVAGKQFEGKAEKSFSKDQQKTGTKSKAFPYDPRKSLDDDPDESDQEALYARYLAEKREADFVSEKVIAFGEKDNLSHFTNRSLNSRNSNIKPSALHHISAFEKERELVSYFLQTGLLPWWFDKRDAADLPRLINRVLTSSDIIQRLVLEQPYVLKRVLCQFNKEQLDYLLTAQNTYLGHDFAAFVQDGIQFLEALGQLEKTSFSQFKAVLWQQIVNLLKAGGIQTFDETMVLNSLVHVWQNQPAFDSLLIAMLKSAIKSSFKSNPTSKSDLVVSEFYKKLCKALRLSDSPEDSAEILEKLQAFKPDHRVNIDLAKTIIARRMMHHLPSVPQIADQPFNNTECIYIANGGLALISELLGDFFMGQHLVEADVFVSEAAQIKAVALLSYMVSGADEYNEYDLPLNKLLCGLTLIEPIETNILLDETDKAACDQLLQKAIDFFPDLHDANIKELQEIFLQRGGSLSLRDRCWLLRVEPEGRDILLKDFPWKHLSIHYPWMLDPIIIEWGIDYNEFHVS